MRLKTFRRGGTAVFFLLLIISGHLASVSAWEKWFGSCKFSDDSGLGTVARKGSCPTETGNLDLRGKGIKILPAGVFANMRAMR